MSTPTREIKLVLRTISRLTFSSHWLQLPICIRLVLAQGVDAFHFRVELAHVLHGNQNALQALTTNTGYNADLEVMSLNETSISRVVRALIDVAMISNLMILVIISGCKASVRKVKLRTAIMGISAIRLFRTAINVGNDSAKVLNTPSVIHTRLLRSARANGYTDRLMQPAPASAH